MLLATTDPTLHPSAACCWTIQRTKYIPPSQNPELFDPETVEWNACFAFTLELGKVVKEESLADFVAILCSFPVPVSLFATTAEYIYDCSAGIWLPFGRVWVGALGCSVAVHISPYE